MAVSRESSAGNDPRPVMTGQCYDRVEDPWVVEGNELGRILGERVNKNKTRGRPLPQSCGCVAELSFQLRI